MVEGEAEGAAVAVPPGSIDTREFLKYEMARLGLSIQNLATRLSIHPQGLYHLTSLKRPISPGMAIKLAEHFQQTPQFWQRDFVDAPHDLDKYVVRPKRPRSAPPKPTQGARGGMLVDEQIERRLADPDSGMMISPYCPEQVQPASYDLRLGLIVSQGFATASTFEWGLILKALAGGDCASEDAPRLFFEIIGRENPEVKFSTYFPLEKNKSIAAISLEWLSFSPRHLAYVGGTAENAKKGLLVNHGFQVDPGYSGPIFVRIMNITEETVDLAAGQNLVSLAIIDLPVAPRMAYLRVANERAVALGNQVSEAIRKLYSIEWLDPRNASAGVEIRGTGFEHHEVFDTRDDAEALLNDLCPDVLRSPGDRRYAHFESAIDKIIVDRDDTEALIVILGVMDAERQAQAREGFDTPRARKLLTDVVTQLGMDLPTVIDRLFAG